MKAKRVVIAGKGPVENVKIESYTVPVPKDHEILVKIEYAGLAYGDLMLRTASVPGMPRPPIVPGADAAGIVISSGTEVSRFSPGDRVAVLRMSDFGGQQEYLCIEESRALPVPGNVSLEEAVCLQINYLTADMLLMDFKKHCRSEQPVILVHGGSGGVGSALIELARLKGMSIYSTASGKNLSFVQDLGASGIDYRISDFTEVNRQHVPGGIDGVFDAIGGDVLNRSLNILKPGGVYVGYGFQQDLEKGASGLMASMIRFLSRKLFTFNKTLIMSQLQNVKTSELMVRLSALFKLCQEGLIQPKISAVFPLDQATEAHRNLEQGNRRGKILLRMAP